MATTWEGGNSRIGFKVEWDARRRILYLRMWGLWDEALGLRFRDAVNEARAPLRPSSPSFVLADLRRYPTQRPAVQKIHAELMSKSASHGILRSANLVTDVLASMQIRRLSNEGGLVEFSFFDDEDKAIAWLRSNESADHDAITKLPTPKRR